MARSQFHPQSPADAAVGAITVPFLVQGRQEGLEGKDTGYGCQGEHSKICALGVQIHVDSEQCRERSLQE